MLKILISNDPFIVFESGKKLKNELMKNANTGYFTYLLFKYFYK